MAQLTDEMRDYLRSQVRTDTLLYDFLLASSRKHLGRYVNEFAFRLNEGNVREHTMKRLDALIVATAHKRITYAELTANG